VIVGWDKLLYLPALLIAEIDVAFACSIEDGVGQLNTPPPCMYACLSSIFDHLLWRLISFWERWFICQSGCNL